MHPCYAPSLQRPHRGLSSAVAQILDQRLQEHEQTALKKFAELNQKLSQHPLLQVLAFS